ncbi:hypothetical protein M0R45_030003 [Rubus argutus]|uniref:Uncharacterized protein n=1 Tax=Rubus argutus TaxID=59490 RepID=A0AAW1WDA1_RUBAR
MTRLSEKLRLSLFLYNPTRFLSPKHLAHFSVSTLHLCKSLARALASKTLALFTMDDPFAFTPDDNDGWDFDLQSRNRAQRPRLLEDYDDDDDVSDNAVDRVYLVPYRWWKEVRTEDDHKEGVLYTSSPEEDDAASEILLNLRKKDFAQQGFSGREYALVHEATWCRALIR